ncbi:thioredoxin fold domain-containing protein [Paenibacillus sp. HJL G12]|uniref:Thioredoxin n=1 Tax=Paenibacillus dendrobii TaxID=2691084 RepID=A0A7X3IMJ8_9BACL|nr:thioredoxin family protein [Paenibacillus dendrobii]MWV46288.1 thioredoxin fold domain-containing protein [Paenibacillus dendrobii]
MSVQTIDASNFKHAIQEKEVTFVDFVTQWCPPCKTLLPILEEMEREEEHRLSVVKVDCSESPEIAAQFGVMGTPTVIVFHNGEPVDKLVGLRPKSVYQAVLSRYA